MPIRVVLAEDNTLLREGIARLLERAEDIELVGTACDRPELEALIESVAIDLVVTDIRMPPTAPTRASRSPTSSAATARRWASSS